MKKFEGISASLYYENTIKIPYKRLATMLKPGDIILGHCYKIGWSTNFIEYRVTHIDKWGVYAYPTDRMLDGFIGVVNKETICKYRRHFKFKWCHINGVIFNEK